MKLYLKQKFPTVKAQINRDKVRMTGPTEALYDAKAYLIRRKEIKTPEAQNIRFTLKTSATRLQILTVIGRQTGRELVYDPALKDVLDQQVEINCRQINLNELVDQILSGSDLKNEVTAKKIQISAP